MDGGFFNMKLIRRMHFTREEEDGDGKSCEGKYCRCNYSLWKRERYEFIPLGVAATYGAAVAPSACDTRSEFANVLYSKNKINFIRTTASCHKFHCLVNIKS